MNIQEIAIKKLRSFYIPTILVNKNEVDRNLLIQLQGEAMRLGFIFKEEALTILANSISDNYTSVFKVLSEPARKIAPCEFSASNWNKRNKEYQLKLRNCLY